MVNIENMRFLMIICNIFIALFIALCNCLPRQSVAEEAIIGHPGCTMRGENYLKILLRFSVQKFCDVLHTFFIKIHLIRMSIMKMAKKL